jgi:hypothetical protein
MHSLDLNSATLYGTEKSGGMHGAACLHQIQDGSLYFRAEPGSYCIPEERLTPLISYMGTI